MQPEKLAEVRSWLKKAAGDLRGADIDMAASPPFIEDMLFHCQQAAEKTMKGFLTAHDRIFRKTHDLDELASACEAVDPTLKRSSESRQRPDRICLGVSLPWRG